MIAPQDILATVEILISTKKSALYKKHQSQHWFDVYKAELALAQEAFIYLHFLEIFLRNKIAIEFNHDFKNWLLSEKSGFKFDFKEQEKVEQVVLTLIKSKKHPDIDNIVSNLSLGFWTNLFHRSYTNVWQQNKMIERVFPFLKSHQRDLKQIQKQLEAIRKFRNRIFHFESLQSWNVYEMKELVTKFIHGISGVTMNEILN